MTSPTSPTSTYEQLGGAPAVSAAVEIFYEKVLNDGALRDHFSGVDVPKLKGHQRAFIAAALGGPGDYLGRDMGPAHAHLGITSEAFAKVVGHLAATLQELGVDDATIGTIAGTLAPLEDQIVTAGR